MTNFALTIAGSEATGGAGAQVDLKTFQAHNVYGIAALTCIVSFDPKNDWSHRFVPVDQQVIADQLEAITGTYDAHLLNTTKIGMLGTPTTIEVVSEVLENRNFGNVVLDPVLICKGQEPGAALDTDNALKSHILPKASIVTPNHFESLSLSGMDEINSVDQLTEAAKRIHDISGAVVIAKGGIRLAGAHAVDVFYDGETTELLSAPKVEDVAVSGAGCTLAAAVTAEIALGKSPLEAARNAKRFVTRAIQQRIQPNTPFAVAWQGN
ncbi:MAG: hydroxymethylpyrimidine/phosphomethylpyrimidine kinase [Canibacter sp.]